jgi:hypothetical protein
MWCARGTIPILLIVASTTFGARVPAQSQSARAPVAVTLRVLPHTSFGHGSAAGVAPDGGSAAIRTRVWGEAAARLVVSPVALRGPDDAVVEVRFACAAGTGAMVRAAEPSDCVHGLLLDGGHAGDGVAVVIRAMPCAMGLRAPAGTYRGRATMTLAHSAY